MNEIYNETFVRVYDNAISNQTCESLIAYFEWCLKNNRTWGRPEPGLLKKDISTALNPTNYWDINFSNENLSPFIGEFNTAFWDRCYKEYTEEFDTLKQFDRHTIYTYKLQKTAPGGGYHIWHCESGSKLFSSRIAAYLLYLNDVANGGETEFLSQGIRVAPKQGTLVIWPASYTHPHRGNPPLSGTKYVMTGWVEFA